MGVIYKINSQVKGFILKISQEKPQLGCRKIPALIEKKFKIKVSKSAVNIVLKEAKLSKPVGRRRKPRKGKIEALGLGAVFLKAADCLLGGAQNIAGAISEKTSAQTAETLPKTEALIYKDLFSNFAQKPDLDSDSWLWALINHRFSNEGIISYLNDIEQVRTLYLETLRIITHTFKEVHCLKVSYPDGINFYLDGQLHTVWSTPNIPHDFSTTIYDAKSYIANHFRKNLPFVLFMAPGYETPSKEFFDFMLNMGSENSGSLRFTLYGNKFEEIEIIGIDDSKKRFFVFGLWPWQFTGFRKIQTLGEFRQHHFSVLNKDLYIADVDVELSQPKVNKSVTLKGCALKSNPGDKIGLAILTNFSTSEMPSEKLAETYLSRWPNLQEGFHDFSRKVELFTYTASSQQLFSTENLSIDKDTPQKMITLFNHYLKALDLYVRLHFFPVGYENKDFSILKEHFYSLKGSFKKHKDSLLVTLKPPVGYAYLKDLEYACRRLNEREISFFEGLKVYCNIG